MYRNILVPVVFDEGHDTKASYLAAQKLADKEATFTVVHVLEDLPNYATTEIPADLLKRRADDTKAALVKSAKALPDAKVELIHGNAGRQIVDYAKQHGVDCIVVASHQLGLADLFLGSTAARVVRHAPCSVHVIR